jgi:hypothetical protein
LRHTLQTEPRIVLLGSATSRFEEIDHPDHALYDLFRVVTLRPLDTDECGALWRAVSGETTTTRTVRPLQIITGGNPRLLAIIARFGAGQSFEELMNNLLDLIDDHTEYFKSHLETLPALERRVYLALARLWKPSTAREIADLARLDTNKCSALLKRLEGRGAVTAEGGTPRRRQYYLTERLYNVYYLLRRRCQTVEAVYRQRNRRPRPPRHQQMQRAAQTSRGTWRRNSRGGHASSPAVLSDRTPLQRLLPATTEMPDCGSRLPPEKSQTSPASTPTNAARCSNVSRDVAP